MVSFTLYFYVLKRMQAGTASPITLITPVTALMIGSAFNGERVSTHVLAGATLVLSGLMLHEWDDQRRRRNGGVAAG